MIIIGSMNSCDRSKIGAGEFLKELNNIHLPDIRWQEGTSPELLERFHLRLKNIELIEVVPNEIFVNFETAKNTLLYSYFSYRLSMAAMIVGFACLESAIAEKAKRVSYRKSMKGLSQKLQAAFANDWIDIRKIANPINSPVDLSAWTAYTESAFIPYLTNLRNSLAHELGVLDFPWRVCENLDMIGKMINELFKVEEVTR